MKRAMLVVFGILGLAMTAGFRPALAEDNALTADEKAKGWRLLFDGKTFDGWKPTGKPDRWVIEDGVISLGAAGGGYLMTQEEFDNFTLSLDFKVGKGANSGVRLRTINPNNNYTRGLEVQILDNYGKKTPSRNDCASIYDCVAPTKNMCKPVGEWQTLVITCDRNRITVTHNGEKVSEMDLDRWTTANQNPDGSHNKFPVAAKEMARKGHLALQEHPGRVWFRNIKILPLP